MDFGTASLGTSIDELPGASPAAVVAASRRHAGGRPPRTYDCGRYGKLTVRQIADIAGITIHGVQVRLRRHWKGEQLCLHISESRRIGWRKRGCSSPTMVLALRLALNFPDRLPTADQIRAIHPMTRDNATHWRSAIRDARLHMGLPL